MAKPSAALLQISHHSSGRIETEHASPGEQHGLHRVDGSDRRQQISFTGAGDGASHIDTSDRARLGEHHRAAGWTFGQRVMADSDTGHGGQPVARIVGRWLDVGRSRPQRCLQ